MKLSRTSVSLLVMLSLSLTLMAEQPNRPTIDVTGAATLDIPPSYAQVSVSVITLDKNVREAQKLNDQKVKQALSVIEKLGILEKDVTTDEVSLEAKEEEIEGKPTIFLGYEATNLITITVRDMKSYDNLIAELLAAGVNRIRRVEFGADDEIAKRKEARILAVKAAKEKADYLAAALGQKVCAPIKIAETARNAYGYGGNVNTEIVVSVPMSSKASLAPRNITITASVDVTFLLCE